jgi:hypothetical protein
MYGQKRCTYFACQLNSYKEKYICGFPDARASFPEGFRFLKNEKPAKRK